MTDVPTPDAQRHTLIEDVAALSSGAFLVSFGLVMLHAAGGISGGIAGVSLLVTHVWPALPLGPTFFVLNLPFYYLAIRRMGWGFSIRTFVVVAAVSALSSYLGAVVHVEIPLFLGTAFAGLCLGLGFIVLFRHRASAGGFGILVFWLQERFHWRAGYVQLALDLSVLVVSFFIVPFPVLLASIVGAAVTNITLAMNHRPGRYVGYTGRP